MVRRHLISTVAALLTLAAAPIAGHAYAGVTGENTPWPWPHACIDAGFTSWSSPNAWELGVDTRAKPCLDSNPPAGARYGLAFYDRIDPKTQPAHGYVHGTRVLPPDGEYLSIALGGLNHPDFAVTGAVCLVSGAGLNDRLACLAVDRVGSALYARPIETADPMVMTAITSVTGTGTTPLCGSCPREPEPTPTVKP